MSGSQPSQSVITPWNNDQLTADAMASAELLRQGVPYSQIIYDANISPTFGSPMTISVSPNAVGLIRRFLVQVDVTVTNPAGGSTLTRSTSWGPFNTLSNITYTDPNTQQRVNTSGSHLASLATRRGRRVAGSAWTSDSPSGFGSVLSPIKAPATIVANTTATVSTIYEIPISLGAATCKAAVFAGAVFSTQQLQLTFNSMFATAGSTSGDGLFSVYTGSGSGANAPTFSARIRVTQEYLDGFDLNLLTMMSPSLSMIYELKSTSYSQIQANADFYIRFTNLRTFLSLGLAYVNNGVLNAGTDIREFGMMQVNQTKLWFRDPQLHSWFTRNLIGADYPPGNYLFDFSDRPVSTAASGNTILYFNPITAVSAVAYVNWEALATQQVLASAPSLDGSSGGQGR